MRRRAALILLVALGLTACGTSAAPPPPSQALGNVMTGAVSKRILDLPLIDSTGRVRHLADFAGKIIVIDPILTLCQETCPLDTAAFTSVARDVAASSVASKVVFLTISVDPQRDTPVQLAAYRALYGNISPNWILLTGTPLTIARLWKYFGVWIQRVPEDQPPAHNWRTGQVLTYDINHTDAVIYIDGHGQERFIIQDPPDVRGSKLPTALIKYMDAQGIHNLHHPNSQAWTPNQALTVLNWLTGTTIKPVP